MANTPIFKFKQVAVDYLFPSLLIFVLGGCSGGGSSNTDSTDSTVLGKGVPFLYQTGYHLVSCVTTNFPHGSTQAYQFALDMERNTIQDDSDIPIFPELVYNDKGRVTTFGFNIFDFNDAAEMVSYNSDGTIAAYTNTNQTDSSYQQFSYSNGQYELHVRGAVKNGENIVYDTIVYNNAADGTPISARFVERNTGEQSDLGYDYTVNQRGLVDSIELVGFLDLGRLSRVVFTYDDNNNIVKLESFADIGELLHTQDFTYVKSPEPVPNMIGFMMITKGGFRIHL